MIELQGVKRRYGEKTAVNGLDLSIPRGELFAFLGPNGAGKTTTVRMLVGLLRPTEGTIRLGGIDVSQQPREAISQLGYVPDEPYLNDKLTGREFLRFILDMFGVEAAAREAAIQREIDHFELSEFVDELAETYSHGMKQRLVFASALLHDPDVLVIDEPMVGLDPRTARLVKDLLRQRSASGKTIFMSTHSLAVAEEIADRIGIITQGRLRFLGTVPELRHELELDDGSLERLFLELTSSQEGAVK